MAKKESPFIGYSEEEVIRMESTYFVLQFGGDFLVQDDYFLFTKAEADKLYRLTLRDLVGIVKDGNDKDRKYALDLIAGLEVKRIKLH
jgi:hypothetical protein